MRGITAVLAVAIVLLALAYSFCHAMASYDHNENMYVTAGVLISQGKSIYHDFAYLQMPYLPELYGAIYRTTGTTHHVLVARIVNWTIWAIGAAVLGWIVWRTTASRSFAVGLALIYLFNASMLRITIESSNYVLPATLALAQVALVVGAIRARGKSGRMACLFLAGAAAGLAVGTKLNFLAAVAPFFVLPLFFRAQDGRRCWICRAGAMGAGFALALAPAALLFARDPAVFIFDNLRFHRLVTAKDRAIHFTGVMTLAGKLSWMKHHYLPELALAMLLAVAVLVVIRRYRASINQDSTAFAATAGGGFALTLLAALYMTPSWPQYFAMPVPYLLLLGAAAYSLRPQWRVGWSALAWTCVVVSGALAINKHDLNSVRNIHQEWVPLALERSAAEVSERMRLAGVSGKVATLQPLFVIEADIPTYREFATGPFLFDIGDALSPAERKHAVGTSAGTLGELLDPDPPAAILVGLYGAWRTEKPLETYALQHHYRPLRLEAGKFPMLTFDPAYQNKTVAPLFDDLKPAKKNYAILYLRRHGG